MGRNTVPDGEAAAEAHHLDGVGEGAAAGEGVAALVPEAAGLGVVAAGEVGEVGGVGEAELALAEGLGVVEEARAVEAREGVVGEALEEAAEDGDGDVEVLELDEAALGVDGLGEEVGVDVGEEAEVVALERCLHGAPGGGHVGGSVVRTGCREARGGATGAGARSRSQG